MVNYLAVIVVTVIGYVIMALWYSSMFFGNLWMRLTKIKGAKMSPGIMIIGLIAGFITTLVLASIISLVSITGFIDGALAGVCLWLGFLAPFLLNEVLYEKRKFALYLLNVVGYLLILFVSGGILAVWQ